MKECPILLQAAMRKAIASGKTVKLRLPVEPSNSTVLGRIPNVEHDAREWFDGWKNLEFGHQRTFVDGRQSKIKDCNIFGYGRNGENFSCGEYLHVPLTGYGEDGDWRSYRVRCRMEPGDILWVRETARMTRRGSRLDVQVLRVRLDRDESPNHWAWVVSLRRASA